MAVILAITILGTGLIGSYTTVPAAEFSAGAIAAGETLEWITAALAGAGISISVKELLKPRQAEIEKDIGKHIDWDNYDWGDMLDSPAAQDQIDELDKTINKLYGNASAKWKEMYEKSLSPTPTPETSPDKPDPSPPVTVAPIDPDKVTPPGWDTLRKASMKNGYLALGAATYWCLKEAAKGLWDKVFKEDPATTNVKNPYAYEDLIGIISNHALYQGCDATEKYYVYRNSSKLECLNVVTGTLNSNRKLYVYSMSTLDSKPYIDFYYSLTMTDGYKSSRNYSSYKGTTLSEFQTVSSVSACESSFTSYIPYVLNGKSFDAAVKPMGKSGIWVNPDLKNDYDNNKAPSIPATAPAPAIKIPSLDDLKDLQNRGNNANDDERPSIILDWLKNHYTNPSTDPNPKPDPDPNPNPDPKPDPDPNPVPNPDPNPNPNPTPTTAPKPDDTNTDVNPDDYKADLRLVFPFCIPFDLIHLIQAFETEPEAPVFEFPFDLELENPWTGKKILDYHHVFKLDMSDYEPVIKIFRIFEIIFFIIGLLMITRQQMIKG